MTKAAKSDSSEIYSWAWFGVAVYAIGTLMYYSYDIRLAAIKEYGPVIHEFDPYFNFRATEVSESSSNNA
jgi:dolichyl-diphosphooligosaccharide--protein glycosyltransferase